MICFKQNLEQRFLGHNQSTSLILGWFFSAFPVVQLFVLGARELKLDTSSQEPRSGPKFQTWVVFNYYSSAQLNPQLSVACVRSVPLATLVGLGCEWVCWASRVFCAVGACVYAFPLCSAFDTVCPAKQKWFPVVQSYPAGRAAWRLGCKYDH